MMIIQIPELMCNVKEEKKMQTDQATCYKQMQKESLGTFAVVLHFVKQSKLSVNIQL